MTEKLAAEIVKKSGIMRDTGMTSATPKPRAGEHVPDKIAMSIDWCVMFDKEHELTARLANDLEEAQANNDANARDATNARAERDLLRERERELVEALEIILRAEFGQAMSLPAGCESTYWGRARALLAKHGR